MLPESALTQMYPVIMTPSHDGKYFHNYVLSLLNIVHTGDPTGLHAPAIEARHASSPSHPSPQPNRPTPPPNRRFPCAPPAPHRLSLSDPAAADKLRSSGMSTLR